MTAAIINKQLRDAKKAGIANVITGYGVFAFDTENRYNTTPVKTYKREPDAGRYADKLNDASAPNDRREGYVVRPVRHDTFPVCLFRYGDFYEAFQEDAVTLAHVCNLTRTSRNGVDMAGFPVHAMEDRIKELLKAGHRVAMCERATS